MLSMAAAWQPGAAHQAAVDALQVQQLDSHLPLQRHAESAPDLQAPRAPLGPARSALAQGHTRARAAHRRTDAAPALLRELILVRIRRETPAPRPAPSAGRWALRRAGLACRRARAWRAAHSDMVRPARLPVDLDVLSHVRARPPAGIWAREPFPVAAY